MLFHWLASLRRVFNQRHSTSRSRDVMKQREQQSKRRATLRFESLEERRLLSATPFANPMTGDATGDGADELFVPNPGVDKVGIVDVGNVSLAFGVPQRNNVPGLDAGVTGLFDARYSDSPNPYSGGPDANWTLGSAIAVADFDNDSLADLAIGVPGHNAHAGQVRVVYSARAADNNPNNNEEIWSQDSVFGGVAVADQSEAVDRFGATLIAGDFDGNGSADLAIAAPLEDVGDVANAGAINVVYSRVTPGFGLDPGVGSNIPGNQFISLDGTGAGTAGQDDRFGHTFAVGRFNNDRFDDLAIGSLATTWARLKTRGPCW
ncbi:MAG: hypothetical protein O3A00_11140 [Planctomycetota bacterium]|nr:hypothetical protein [Planctomycetota bacterium]